MSHPLDDIPVRVYLCACGPIIGQALDLDGLAEGINHELNVEIRQHPTLCSEEGKTWLAEQLASQGEARSVIAACSPREHGETFRKVYEGAGVNPYLMTMAAIREQAAWVTPDRDAAGEKANALVRAAIARVRRQTALETRTTTCNPDVLVVGAGVAGLTAAKLLADADRQVVLVERLPAIGGQVARLSELYPGDECASCVLEPLMDEVHHHDRVELITGANVTEILGFLGNYQVEITRWATRVDPEICYGCHTCHEACPVEMPREADEGLSTRKAIYVPYTGAVPNVSAIDPQACLRDRGESCDACAGVCPFGAIDLDATPKVETRAVGAVVLATGGEMVLPEAWEGHPRVLSATALERLLSDAGPTSGKVTIADREPRAVALVHGADPSGLRAGTGGDGLTRLLLRKYVHELGAKLPHARIHEVAFRPDRQSGGSAPADNGGSRRHELGTADCIIGLEERVGRGALRLSIRGNEVTLPVDLVVALPSLRGATAAQPLANLLTLEFDEHGYFVADHAQLRPYQTRQEGVYIAGMAAAAMDMQRSAAAGAAAAAGALSALVPGRELTLTPVTATVLAELCGSCRTCTQACPYHATRMNEETGKAEVNEMLCRGCGCCAASCPSGAIETRHYTQEQLHAELDALLDPPRSAEGEPEFNQHQEKGS